MEKMTWSIKHIYVSVGIIAVLLAVVAIGSTILSQHYDGLADEAAVRRYQSNLFANELRQNADDLTRLARTYIISGDPKWEKQYFEILDIRNGKQAIPGSYERIYWDFHVADRDAIRPNGGAIALLDLMKQMGFPEAELNKLAEAQANLNNMVAIEIAAMKMAKGLYADEQGQFARKAAPDIQTAREMVYDQTYHQNKAKIIALIDEFLAMLDKRTTNELAAVKANETQWAIVAMLATGMMVIFVLLTLFLVQRRTSAVLSEVNGIAKQIAEGDLSSEIKISDNSEEGKLLVMINDMQEKLAEVVSTIRGSTDSVVSVSTEIAQNGADLSQLHEAQATALEQVAVSMDLFNSSVNQNADNVKHASQLATKANQIAVESRVAVSQVVNTMNEISESSQKITGIIGIIDSIACQTNTLALNASVEAARVGEQGCGLAVVVNEVRRLAQRSAEAAKEMKTLIVDSVERSEQGSIQADQTRVKITEIVDSIRHVTDIMNEIGRSAVEQQAGISQVSRTVMQIDQSTQFNTSLVERTTDATENLKEQTGQLVASISYFKLGHDVLGHDNSRSATVPALLISKPKLYVVK